MTAETKSPPSEAEVGRRELRSLGINLMLMIGVVVLALRGTFSSMWFFPHIFGGIMAVLSLISLRAARGALWPPVAR